MVNTHGRLDLHWLSVLATNVYVCMCVCVCLCVCVSWFESMNRAVFVSVHLQLWTFSLALRTLSESPSLSPSLPPSLPPVSVPSFSVCAHIRG